MNTYAVKFLKGTDIEIAYVQGINQSEAKKEFSNVYPDIVAEKIISVTDIKEQTNDYGAAIKMAKYITFLGWAAVIIGILLTVSVVLSMMGVPVLISGFMLIMGGQITRATADNANYSKQMLDEMRNRK